MFESARSTLQRVHEIKQFSQCCDGDGRNCRRHVAVSCTIRPGPCARNPHREPVGREKGEELLAFGQDFELLALEGMMAAGYENRRPNIFEVVLSL